MLKEEKREALLAEIAALSGVERASLLIRANALIRQLPDRKLEEIMTEMEEDAWAFCM